VGWTLKVVDDVFSGRNGGQYIDTPTLCNCPFKRGWQTSQTSVMEEEQMSIASVLPIGWPKYNIPRWIRKVCEKERFTGGTNGRRIWSDPTTKR